jgi:DNA-binding NarL/FixJ family response regulator
MSLRARVLVVDDCAPFRQTMRSLLSRHPELVVIAEASDGLEAVHKSEDLRPDLVVIDLNMPRLNGLEATRRIRKLSPNSKIILVSLESSIEFMQAALACGAAGYVVKTDVAYRLVPAIEAALQGLGWASNG